MKSSKAYSGSSSSRKKSRYNKQERERTCANPKERQGAPEKHRSMVCHFLVLSSLPSPALLPPSLLLVKLREENAAEDCRPISVHLD